MKARVLPALVGPAEFLWAPMLPGWINFTFQLTLFFVCSTVLGINPLPIGISIVGTHAYLVYLGSKDMHFSDVFTSFLNYRHPNKNLYRTAEREYE